MKKLVLILALIPLLGFAEDKVPPKSLKIFNKQCENMKDPAQRKKHCLTEEKQKEAAENFRNFQENNRIETTF